MNRRSFISAAGAATAATSIIAKRALARSSGHGTQPDPIQQALLERKGSLKGLPEPLSLPRRTTAGLEPYVPSPSNPWDRQKAVYLLRRTMFGAKKADVDAAVQMTPAQVVDMLFVNTPMPQPPSWVTEDWYYDSARDSTRVNEFYIWWLRLMVAQPLSIREKMVLFWHDHFATEYQTVNSPQFNYWFINLFRSNPLGDYRQLVKDMALQPAMLMYLNGNVNVKARPNENFARELMELHTLGEGNGYTEDDIRNSARALTGWTLKTTGQSPVDPTAPKYDPSTSVFVAANHDDNDKTFLGLTGNWGATDVVDIIFSAREREAATYICRKLYREFVYEIADETVVGQMADLLVASQWEMEPVLSTLLKSAHFFDVANIGAHITSPIEFYVGAIRSLEIVPATDAVYTSIFNLCAQQGLQLLQPPNVKGWPGYRAWITASRLASRWDATDGLINDAKNPPASQRYQFDPVAFVTRISDPGDAHAITDDVIALLYDLTLNAYQTEVLLEKFLSGWRDYEWDIVNPGATDRLITLFKQALRNNEAQLI